MDLYVITGVSRGVGESLARLALKNGDYVVGLSRSFNQSLMEYGESISGDIECYSLDFSDSDEVEVWADGFFEQIDESRFENIYLVNNAGMVDPIKTTDRLKASDISKSFNVNLVSLMTISSSFIRHFENVKKRKRIFNISSGAARDPYHGWSVYCSTKAAVDMFTRCVDEEQRKLSNPVEITAFAPGIVDTSMQNTIRTSNVKDFPMLETFKKFKQNGNLRKPEDVAGKIVGILKLEKYPSGKLIDISDY